MIFYRILPNLCLGVIEIRVGLCVGKFILKLMICKIFVCEEFLSPSVSALIQRVWAHHQQIQKKKKKSYIFNAQLVLYCSFIEQWKWV